MTTTVPIHPLPEILLLTHGGWGLQLCNSLRMVMGEIEGVTEIALMPVDTLGEFYQRVEAVVKTMPEGSLIVTDFIGGTTSNVAARLSADYPVAVISGLNASLLLEALDKRTWPTDRLRGRSGGSWAQQLPGRRLPYSSITTVRKIVWQTSCYVALTAVLSTDRW